MFYSLMNKMLIIILKANIQEIKLLSAHVLVANKFFRNVFSLRIIDCKDLKVS